MARTGFWMRGAKGKFAGASFSSSPYGTIQRDIVAVRNPKTAKQSVQRMIMATTAKVTAALRPLVDHSFESKQKGVKSVAHFQTLAMNSFRKAAAEYLNNPNATPSNSTAIFSIKGATIAGCVDGLILSQGRLPGVITRMVSEDDIYVPIYPNITIKNAEEYIANLRTWGLEPGDQVTIVYYYRNLHEVVAEFDEEKNYADMYRYSRFVFKPVNEIDFSSTIEFLDDDNCINPVLLKYIEGVQPEVTRDGNTCYLRTETPGNYASFAVAVVRSQKQSNGKYLYSNSKFTLCAAYDLDCDYVKTYMSYMDSATEINVGDRPYLRHAEQV